MKKKCYKCHKIKPVSSFSRNRAMPSGLSSGCKLCMRAAKRKWHQKNKASENAKARRYYYAHHERCLANHRRYSKTEYARRCNHIYILRSIQKHRWKLKARIETKKAIYHGILKKQPCQVCGSKKSHVHHLDYTKPLLIEWLCRKHHMERHRRYATAA